MSRTSTKTSDAKPPRSITEAKAIAEGYARDIESGKIPACKWIKLAVQRDKEDRKRALLPSAEIRFNEKAAWLAVHFFSFLRHSKGELGGKEFVLSPWQLWATWVLFGWYRQNDAGNWIRRFNTFYSEIARKAGKSTWLAGIGLYLFDGESEPGAEVYTAATKRDQARIVHEEAVRMVKTSPVLKKRITVLKDNLNCKSTFSKFEPLGADADSTDGLNIHGAIVDELHAHKSRAMWSVLETATGARRNPLIAAITTAGSDDTSICWEVRKYGVGILEKTHENDTWFVLIFTLDEDDDWTDERCWIKANPNLGVSNKYEDIRRKVKMASEVPAARNDVLRLHFNIWVRQTERAIPMEWWNACSDYVDEKALEGRTCYGGLDLSKTSDITAFILLFPPVSADEPWKVVCRFWLPENSIEKKTGRDRENHQLWVQQGAIIECNGDRIDFAQVRHEIEKLSERYNILEIAYDPWNAEETRQELERAGLRMIEFKQTIGNFTEPFKTLLDDLKANNIAHSGHPVLKWMADCVEAKYDPNGNMRPVKPDTRKTTARIDGIVALLMARGRAIAADTQPVEIRVI